MDRIKLVMKSLMLGWLVVALGLCACNSSKTSESGESDLDSPFVASDDATGTITLTAYTNPLAVGSTGKFRVTVLDMNGDPVPQIDVSCDSEKEIAIVEPTLGHELTDAWGNMSGVYGCVAEGSFQLACRLPLGANKRDFVTIVCQGTAPPDFQGWPDAAGGTLGGGVDTSDQEGEGEFGIRITSLSFEDGPNDNTFSIDVVQDVCDATATPVDYEFFTDTIVTFRVVNNSNQIVRFSRYSYVVSNFDGAGNKHFSPSLSLIGEAEVSLDANGGEGEFSAVFMDANGGGKRYFGRTENVSGGGIGFKNIKFTLNGKNSSNDDVKAVASTSLSMDNFDNCQ